MVAAEKNLGRVSLVCVDLDGTLLSPDKTVSVANRAALERARMAGLRVAVASGRHPLSIYELTDELGLERTAVSLSGAYVTLRGLEVFRHPLDCSAALEVVDVAERLGCYVSVAGPDFNLTCGRVTRVGAPSRAVEGYDACESYDALRARVERSADQLLKAALHADDEASYRKLRALVDRIGGVSVSRSDALWLDVVSMGCSKAEGIAFLARGLGIPLDEVAAIGDDENDVESMGAVGVGIAMGNAIEAVRDAADVIVADNEHDGVAEAIEAIISTQGGA